MKPAPAEAKVLGYVEHLYWLVQASNLLNFSLGENEILKITDHWFLINDKINVNVCMDEVAISRPPHCTLNAHQAMLFCP